ncbi:MAG: fasciclin domain-containing protein [Phycisphaeraceae bacterium]|nr:fasciclin domain-containing protein [Phycisphaeraceae bacterium]
MKTAHFFALAMTMASGGTWALGDGCSSSSDGRSGEQKVTITRAAHQRDDKSGVHGSEKDIIETAAGAGKFKTLYAAIEAAGLVETLKGSGPFTVFAPTDEAFEKLGTGTVEELLKPENKGKLVAILTYHVVPSKVLSKDVRTMEVPTVNGQRLDVVVKNGTVRVDNATVVMADVVASNGVIHAIDTVLLPTDKTVVEVAMKAGNFNTLCRLLKAADWVEPLNGAGPFTVFAPTDEAFAKLDPATLESLAKPENKAKLAAILKFHVVKGRIFSDQAIKAGTAKTAQGQSVHITSKGGTVMIDGATVVKADVEASNGVIHVIDTVLLPN